MAYSTQRAESDGTLQDLGLEIEFIDRENVAVFIDDVLQEPGVDFEWVDDTLIHFTNPVPDGSAVLLQRNTALADVLNIFTLGAVFDNPTMDENFKQLLFIAQEAREGSTLEEVFRNLNMHGFRIQNLGAGTEPADAVNRAQLDSVVAAATSAASGYAIAAAGSADLAQKWADSPENVPVVPGRFSAMHWAIKAQAAATRTLHADDFGLLGDGSDETAKVQAAVTAASTQRKVLVGDRTKTYKITGQITGASNCHIRDFNIDASTMTGTKHALVFQGALGSNSALTADAAANTFSLAVTDGAIFSAGEWVLLTVDTSYYPYSTYNVARGEWVQIRSVSGNTVNITTPLVQAYTTAAGAKLRKCSFVENVVLDNVQVLGSGVANSNERGICFRFARFFDVRNCVFTNLDQYALEVSSSIKFTLQHNRFRGTFYDGVTGTIFYAIVLLDACQYFTVHDNHGARSRHLVVTTAASAGQGRWGQCMFGIIHSNVVEDCMSGGGGRSYAYEMHGTGQHLTWANNIANGCYSYMRIEGGSDSQVIGGGCNGYAYQGLIIGGNGNTVRNVDIRGVRLHNYTGEVVGMPAAIRLETSALVENVAIDGVQITNAVASGAGAAVSVGAATTSWNNSVKNLQASAGTVESTGYAVAFANGATGFLFENCALFGWRGGYSLAAAAKNVVKGGSVVNFAAGATGFGYYSNGDRNICKGVHFRNINTAIRLDTGSTNNLAVENTMTDCTVPAPSNAGTGNTVTNNYTV